MATIGTSGERHSSAWQVGTPRAGRGGQSSDGQAPQRQRPHLPRLRRLGQEQVQWTVAEGPDYLALKLDNPGSISGLLPPVKARTARRISWSGRVGAVAWRTDILAPCLAGIDQAGRQVSGRRITSTAGKEGDTSTLRRPVCQSHNSSYVNNNNDLD